MEFKINRYHGTEGERSENEEMDLFQARIEERRRKRKEHMEDLTEQCSKKKEKVEKKKKKKDDDFEEIASISVPDVEADKSSDHKIVDTSLDFVDLNSADKTTDLKHDSAIKKGKRSKQKQKHVNSEQRDNLGAEEESESSLHFNEITNQTDIPNGNENCKIKRKKKKHLSENVDDTSNPEIAANETTSSGLDNVEHVEEKQDAETIIKEGNAAALTENEMAGDTEDTENYFPILGKHKKPRQSTVKRTLPRWLNEPIVMPADINSSKICLKSVNYLSQAILKNLRANDIEFLFPVQSSVISTMVSQNKKIFCKFPPRDICVQAPTGSGKTLAYVLPIIDILLGYIVKQLYCLVVVPSKDLAVQVYKVFETYIAGTNLKVGIASGLKTFSKEQEKLVAKDGSSKVHIIVCTPGRLVDHLKQTPGFTLKHLRFLVVDEADRLLAQDYSSWLEEVKLSVHSSNGYINKRAKLNPLNASTFMAFQIPFQKLLFSATLTQNPEKIAPLDLFHPVLFTSKLDHSKQEKEEEAENLNMVHADVDRFIIPEKLEEKIIVVEIDQKPLVLVYLMLVLNWKGVLCFTKSIKATHRLCLLLQSFAGFTVAEFSSSLSEIQRKGIIRDFNSGKVDLLISSDAMARGMDIDTVKLVVNYDTAGNAKTYVHRVGRTARAGKEGCAITILCSKEVYHFKLMMKKLTEKRIPKMSVSKNILDSYHDEYCVALSSLQEKISVENKSINTANFVKRT